MVGRGTCIAVITQIGPDCVLTTIAYDALAALVLTSVLVCNGSGDTDLVLLYHLLARHISSVNGFSHSPSHSTRP